MKPHEQNFYCPYSYWHSGLLSSHQNCTLSSAYSILGFLWPTSPNSSKFSLQTSSKDLRISWPGLVTATTPLLWPSLLPQLLWPPLLLVTFVQLWPNTQESNLKEERFIDLSCSQLQKVQSLAAWPHALEQNIKLLTLWRTGSRVTKGQDQIELLKSGPNDLLPPTRHISQSFQKPPPHKKKIVLPAEDQALNTWVSGEHVIFKP
jgi:hypothetical protein